MAKGGRLNNVEKMAIQGGLAQGKSVEEIAEAIDRTPRTVNNYVDGELDQIHTSIARAQMDAAENGTEEPAESALADYEPVQEKPRRFSSPTKEDVAEARPTEKVNVDNIASRDVIVTTFNRLRKEGLTENDANQVVRSALEYAASKGWQFQGHNAADKFYVACLKRMNAGHFIQKTTQGGNDGVAIMSPAASQRLDEARKTASGNRYSRSARGNVFNPSTGQME